MEIKEEKYQVKYDAEDALITFQGSLLLSGTPAYEPILNVLKNAAEEQQQGEITLDISELGFLNSSGINMITRFIMYVIDVKQLQLKMTLRGKKRIVWHQRLGSNLQRLTDTLQVEMN